jgi:hypothetical protein
MSWISWRSFHDIPLGLVPYSSASMFASLRTLLLTFDQWEIGNEDSDLVIPVEMQERLGCALKYATQLEHLDLTFGHLRKGVEIEYPNYVHLGHVIGDTTFHNLDTLDLTRIMATQSELCEFLLRHAARLNDLTLSCLAIDEGTAEFFESFFTFLRDELSLEFLLLRSSWHVFKATSPINYAVDLGRSFGDLEKVILRRIDRSIEEVMPIVHTIERDDFD